MTEQLTHHRRRPGPITTAALCLTAFAGVLNHQAIEDWAKDKLSANSSDSQGTSQDQNPVASNDHKKYASPDSVRQAVKAIQTHDDIRCPDKAEYQMKLESKDPASTICIETDSMDIDAKGTLIVRLTMGPDYAKLINLGASLSGQKKEECDTMAQRLTAYTEDLLRQTEKIPADQGIKIGLVTGAQIDTPCYVYSPVEKDQHIIKPE